MTDVESNTEIKLIIASTIVVLIATVAFISMPSVRDLASLLYWRARYFHLPRAVGSGPAVIIQKNNMQPIAANLIGISEKEWQVSHSWAPRSQTANVSSNCILVALGCWWDNAGSVSKLPDDSKGEFMNAIERKVGLADAPLQNQIAYQPRPAAGAHAITPPSVGNRGDGYFMVLEIEGVDLAMPIRDTGQSRKSHPLFGQKDPNSIQSLSVSTDGTAAQPGDLAIAVFSVDPVHNPDMNIDLPEGWTSIGFNEVALQNIAYRSCCKIVTTAGRQSATCNWTDDSTFVAEATLLILKKAQDSLAGTTQ